MARASARHILVPTEEQANDLKQQIARRLYGVSGDTAVAS